MRDGEYGIGDGGGPNGPGLLVSVRSAPEAEAALAGGAALIDVKEPAEGALGRAGDAVLADVVRTVAGRRPVSAALGELRQDPRADLPPAAGELAYVKWGLAGYLPHGPAVWQSELAGAARRVAAAAPRCRVVAVAYADWRRAQAPAPDEVCTFALGGPVGALLLDTWEKDGSTLLDWLPPPEVARLCARCRAAGLRVALAGSLGPAEIRALRPAGPDWFAVRGAACPGRRRGTALDAGKVRQLVGLLAEPVTAATPGS